MRGPPPHMQFLDVGPFEFAIIMAVALLVFGPKRLPEVLSQVGGWIGKIRRMADDVTNDFRRELNVADALRTPSYTPPPPPLPPIQPLDQAPPLPRADFTATTAPEPSGPFQVAGPVASVAGYTRPEAQDPAQPVEVAGPLSAVAGYRAPSLNGAHVDGVAETTPAEVEAPSEALAGDIAGSPDVAPAPGSREVPVNAA